MRAGFILLCLSLSLPVALSQPVQLSGGAGCIEQQPGPPTNVEVTEQSSKLLVTWDPPSSNDCVDAYVLDLFLPGKQLPMRSSSTSSGDAHTFEGLKNGQEYIVRVKAYLDGQGDGEAYEVRATPNESCKESLKPDRIKDLRVAPGDGMVELCWDGVENGACVDTYKLSYTTVQDSNKFRNSQTSEVSSGGCKTISRLDNNVQYEFQVVAVNDEQGSSERATTKAVVGSSSSARELSGWTCKQLQGCQPDVTSACSVLGCTSVSRLGLCGSLNMYSLNYLKREIDQWCSEECGCDTSVPLTWMPARSGVLSGLTEAFDFSNAVNTFTDALAVSDGSSSSKNVFEEARADLENGAQETAKVLQEAFQKAFAQARKEGDLLGGGVTQNVLQQAADSGVLGQAAGEFIGDTVQNIVTQGVNNVVGSWVGTILSGFGAISSRFSGSD